MRHCGQAVRLSLRRQVTQFFLKPKVFVLPLLLAFPVTSLGAENSGQALQDLERVNSAIVEIQSWLDEADNRRSADEQSLKQAELEIASQSRAVADLQSRIDSIEAELAGLRLQRERLAGAREAQQLLLNKAIRAAYLAGEANQLKMLLNREDFFTSARLLRYARLFSEAQLGTIESYQQTLDESVQVNSDLERNLDLLVEQRARRDTQLLSLNEARTRREGALAELNAGIVTRSAELEQLERDQAELQTLIEEIRRAMDGVRSFADVSPFEDRRGRLPAPVAGPVESRFGSRYGDGSLSRQGITINAGEGTPVQAVHAGRVVFSDWLRGSGLLVIVDHGDGYLSLYGANQTLTKQAGDWVNAGDMLATSGRGGTGDSPGLYFEIRHHGEPRNPADWLAGPN